MGNNEKKLYRIKTKDGAHVNEKIKEDGSRAAIQFDEDNGLQGPVDLLEVDEDEYTREVYIEIERKERSFGEVILEDAVAPALADTLTVLLERAIDAGVNTIGNVITQKVIPTTKAKSAELIGRVKNSRIAKKEKKVVRNTQTTMMPKENYTVVSKPSSKSGKHDKVYHSQEEVDQIINNMRFAALYIAVGIRELSNTVVSDYANDPEKALEIQTKLKELSSEQVMSTIDFMLEDGNKDKLDQATLQLFEAFRNRDFIVDGEKIPISKYFEDEKVMKASE